MRSKKVSTPPGVSRGQDGTWCGATAQDSNSAGNQPWSCVRVTHVALVWKRRRVHGEEQDRAEFLHKINFKSVLFVLGFKMYFPFISVRQVPEVKSSEEGVPWNCWPKPTCGARQNWAHFLKSRNKDAQTKVIIWPGSCEVL